MGNAVCGSVAGALLRLRRCRLGVLALVVVVLINIDVARSGLVVLRALGTLSAL